VSKSVKKLHNKKWQKNTKIMKKMKKWQKKWQKSENLTTFRAKFGSWGSKWWKMVSKDQGRETYVGVPGKRVRKKRYLYDTFLEKHKMQKWWTSNSDGSKQSSMNSREKTRWRDSATTWPHGKTQKNTQKITKFDPFSHVNVPLLTPRKIVFFLFSKVCEPLFCVEKFMFC